MLKLPAVKGRNATSHVDRCRILRVAVVRVESGDYPSATRVAELVGCNETTVRMVLREALDVASRLVPITRLAELPDAN